MIHLWNLWVQTSYGFKEIVVWGGSWYIAGLIYIGVELYKDYKKRPNHG